MRRLVLPFALVLLLAVALAAMRPGDSSREASATHPTTTIGMPTTTTLDPYPALGAYLADVQAHEVGDYLQAVAAADVVRYVEAQNQAAATVVPISSPGMSAPVSTRTGGGHSDAWWQGVAMCEQGGRNDPYFGYFSFMDGSQGGRPWADQVAAGNALLAGQSSESPAWAPACVAAGYAASPGG